MLRPKSIISFLLLTVAVSCSKTEDTSPPQNVLATVGDEVITAREFRLNYEFGYPQLMEAPDRKRAYLNRMIYEKLIAKKGYDAKIDTTALIHQSVQTIKERRLIQEVFNREVLSNITITGQEIKQEINKRAVSFTFKFIPVRNREEGLQIRQQLMNQPFETVVANYNQHLETARLDVDNLTSDQIKATDIDPNILQQIQNLELNTPSEPIKNNDQWYLFIITNIVREPLTPNDYEKKRSSARKVIYNRKAMAGATEFVSSTMEPLNVITKSDLFLRLSKPMFNWYAKDKPVGYVWEKILQSKDSASYLGDIYRLRNQQLVTFGNQSWSVEQFFDHFNASRYIIKNTDYQTFRARFKDVVGLVVRDYILLQKAKNEDFDQDPEVQAEIKRWKDKYVFQLTRQHILDSLAYNKELVMKFARESDKKYAKTVSDTQLSSFTKKQIDQIKRDYMYHSLDEIAQQIRDTIPVTINQNMLDTLEVSSENSSLLGFQVMQQNSNRPAYPVVDPRW